MVVSGARHVLDAWTGCCGPFRYRSSCRICGWRAAPPPAALQRTPVWLVDMPTGRPSAGAGLSRRAAGRGFGSFERLIEIVSTTRRRDSGRQRWRQYAAGLPISVMRYSMKRASAASWRAVRSRRADACRSDRGRYRIRRTRPESARSPGEAQPIEGRPSSCGRRQRCVDRAACCSCCAQHRRAAQAALAGSACNSVQLPSTRSTGSEATSPTRCTSWRRTRSEKCWHGSVNPDGHRETAASALSVKRR